MKISEFFSSTYDINWDRIELIPQCAVLKDIQQNSDYHKEGNVWRHTKLVGNAMQRIVTDEDKIFSKYFTEENALSSIEKRCLIVAAICHDLGKVGHTFFDKTDNQWHCKKHGFYGENIVRELLYDENVYVRETICALVKSHMLFHHIFDEGKEAEVDDKLISLSWSNAPVLFHIAMHIADCLGTINDDMTEERILEKVKRIWRLCKQFGILKYPSEDNLTNRRFRRFYNDENVSVISYITFFINRLYRPLNAPILHIMMGLPGSGKDTFIKTNLIQTQNLETLDIISRDSIRLEMGIPNKNNGTKAEEKLVTEKVHEMFDKSISNKHSIILNGMHTNRWTRRDYILKALKAGYMTIFHIIEAPSYKICKERRKGMFPESVFNHLISNFEFPNLREADLIVIHKQSFVDGTNEIVTTDYPIMAYPINYKHKQ